MSCAVSVQSNQAAVTDAWVRDYYELFHQEVFDLDRLMSYYDESVEFTDPTFDIEAHGRTEVRKLYEYVGTPESSYSGVRWTLDRVLIDREGEDVAIYGSWAGAFRGAAFDIRFVTLWRVREGKIVRQIDFFDAPTFDAQVGWDPDG